VGAFELLGVLHNNYLLKIVEPSNEGAKDCDEYRQAARTFAQHFDAPVAFLSIGIRQFFHTIGYNGRELRGLLAQFRIFRNVALNAIASVL
jgi:endo-alpha-1,4-polygalactosaminidase (GH114 family)